jgi:hypothetical protein
VDTILDLTGLLLEGPTEQADFLAAETPLAVAADVYMTAKNIPALGWCLVIEPGLQRAIFKPAPGGLLVDRHADAA